MAKNKARVLLVATVKNEGPNILEWVAHHRLAGFDQIQIYQNDSSDMTVQTLRTLDRMGVIQYFPNRHNKGAHQVRAYKRAARTEAHHKADWCMVLDGDEFLNVKTGDNTVQSLIKACPRQADAILVNWRVFGSGGETEFSTDLITQRFTSAEPEDEIAHGLRLSAFKPLYRTDAYKRPAIHLPRDPLKHDTLMVNGSGLKDGDFKRRNWRSADPKCRKFAQVNHYMLRDLPSFLLKHARGSANAPHRDVGLKYWHMHNRNEAQDTGLAQRAPAVWDEMQQLDEASGGKLLQFRNRSIRQWRLALNRALERPEIADLRDAILDSQMVDEELLKAA